MPDTNETLEAKISKNVEMLREALKPLTVGLPPDVEPATVYALQPIASSSQADHDD